MGCFLKSNERCQYPRAEPWTQSAMADYSAAEPRGIDTFRSLHSLRAGTNKLSRSTHSFENKLFSQKKKGVAGKRRQPLLDKKKREKLQLEGRC